MLSCKSSPLIEQMPGVTSRYVKRESRRQSRRESKGLPKEIQYKIANPFRMGQEEHCLPQDIRKQIEGLEYISPNQVQSIHFQTNGARRSSMFGKHLQAMQSAARKQEEKYHYILGGGMAKDRSRKTQGMMEQQPPMTIEENQNMSMGMRNHFFEIDRSDHEQDQFNFFQNYNENEVVFYSQHQILGTSEMRDDYEAYFNP